MRYTMQGAFPSYTDRRPIRPNTLPVPWGRSERTASKPSIIPAHLSPNREEHHAQLSAPDRLSGQVSYSSGPWQDEEDNILLNARLQGHGWGQIQREHFPLKTPNACRKRYERLVAKKRGNDWDEEKFEKLGVLYKQLREQIWKPLADAMDEPWEDIEKACFGRGLRSLKSTRKTRPDNAEKHHADMHGDNIQAQHREDDSRGKKNSMPRLDQLLS